MDSPAGKLSKMKLDRTAALRLLLDVSNLLSSDLDQDFVLATAMEQAKVVTQSEASTLWLMGDDGRQLVPYIARGGSGEALRHLRATVGEGIVGTAALTGETINIRDAQNDPRVARRFDRTTGFITRSMLTVPLRGRTDTIGVLQVLNKGGDQPFDERDEEVLRAFAQLAARSIENSRLHGQVKDLLLSLMRSLAAAIDARDPYTAGHSERVARMSLGIGRRLGLPALDLEHLERAALLHDVGKIGVPDAILRKPGRLDDEERRIMSEHPAIGAQILAGIQPKGLAGMLVQGARHHHERYDGGGYPDGLVGEATPLFGRIIGVSDTYDAMTSDRPYRKGLPREVALAEVARVCGTQLDPACVDAFLADMEDETEAMIRG